jgi:hypothetical protein
VAQVVEHLPSKGGALNLNPSTAKKPKQNKEKYLLKCNLFLFYYSEKGENCYFLQIKSN